MPDDRTPPTPTKPTRRPLHPNAFEVRHTAPRHEPEAGPPAVAWSGAAWLAVGFAALVIYPLAIYGAVCLWYRSGPLFDPPPEVIAPIPGPHADASLLPPCLTAGDPPPAACVVGKDLGGAVRPRAELIARLRAAGTRAEITGPICASACTLFLGLPNACLSPSTVFGFHGPSSHIYGVGLAGDELEDAVALMARHYPEPVRSNFLREWRWTIVGLHEVPGRTLIDLGVRPACFPGEAGE